MTIKSKKFTKGIITKPTTTPAAEEGEQRTDSSEKRQKIYVEGRERIVVTEDQSQELTFKTLDSSSNQIHPADTNFSIKRINSGNSSTIKFDVEGTADFSTTIVSSQTADINVTLPSETTTIVGRDTTDILKNKTIDATSTSPDNNTIMADAADIVYDDNLVEGPDNPTLGATDVQGALDAVKTRLDAQNDANEISYDSNTSGLGVANVQAAIDAVDGNLDAHIDNPDAHDASAISYDNSNSSLGASDVQSVIDINAQSISGNVQAISNVSGDFSTHKNAFENVHGVGLGNTVVGTGTAQELSNKTMTDELKFKKLGDTPTVLGTDEVSIYPKSDGKFYKLTNDGVSLIEEELGAGTGGTGGGGATSFQITQTDIALATTGVVVGDGIYHNGTSFVKARADLADTLAYYVVTKVIDDDNIIATDFGRIEATGHGFSVGSFYFLSESNPGEPVDTEPTVGFSNPLFYVEDVNTLQIKVYRPAAVGQTIALNDISDVDIPAPNGGEVLTYNSNSLKWESAAGGATQLDDLTDVTIAAIPNPGDILEWSGSAFVPVAPSAGGGGGATVIPNGTPLNTLYDGDILLEGSATLTADTVIRGNVHFINPFYNITGAFNLTVTGNVYGNSSTIDLKNLAASQNAGSFICNGSVYDSTIYTYTNTNSGTPGNIEISGNYISPDRFIYAYGASSTNVGQAPTNGGNVTVGGDLIVYLLRAYGGAALTDCDQNGADGGTITVGGDLIVTNNVGGALRYYGGNASGASSLAGGNAGSLSVGGSCRAGDIDGYGGSGKTVGGTGGTLFVKNDLTVVNNIDLNGGGGATGGNANQTIGDGGFIVGGELICNRVYISGGAGSAGNGGAALHTATLGKVNVAFDFNAYGGDGTNTNGSTSINLRFDGGGFIKNLNFKDGNGGAPPTTICKVSLRNGHYQIDFADIEDRANVTFSGLYSTLSLQAWAAFSKGILYSDSGTASSQQMTPIDYIYKFGASSSPVRRSAVYSTF